MNIQDLTKFLFSYKSLFIILITFILLILYTLTALSKVFFILVEYIKLSVFTDIVGSSINTFGIFIELISILIAFYLLFIIYSVISAVATYNSYEIAAQKYSFEKPHLENVLFKTIKWNFYRILYVLSPILSIAVIIGILTCMNVFLFRVLLHLAGISIGLVTFLTSFISISLVISLIIAVGIVIYNVFTTLFGIECAVSEPGQENNVIRKRSQKLLLANKSNIKLYVFYFIFLSTLFLQFTGILLFPDILNMENILILVVFAAIDIIFYIGLGYFKSSLYIESILHQYDRITFKDKNSLIEIVYEL